MVKTTLSHFAFLAVLDDILYIPHPKELLIKVLESLLMHEGYVLLLSMQISTANNVRRAYA